MTRKIYVCGLGLFTSLGADAPATWAAMLQGRSGVRRITRFSPAGLPAQIAAMTDNDSGSSCGRRSLVMASKVAAEAVASAGLAPDAMADAGFFLAAPTPDNDWSKMMLAREGRNDLRAVFFDDERVSGFGDSIVAPYAPHRPAVLVNTACASGSTALEMAMEAILDGEHDLALVAGSDSSIYDESIAKFCLLSALSTANDDPAAACRPFSKDRDGFVMGEGAGAVLLASEEAVERFGLRPLARLRGAGNATDGFHRTRSSPDGSSIIASMRRALENSRLDPSQVSHINTHGTGTPENDKMESLGIREIFGADAARIPLTANKSMLGHTLTAAGVIEAAVSVLTLQNAIIPPTINYRCVDAELGVNVVGNVAQRASVRHVLSNSFGFGGQNVSVIFSHPQEA